VSGFDNSFEQELQNVICTHPSVSCTQEGTPAPVAGNNAPPPTDDGTDEDTHDGDKNTDDKSRLVVLLLLPQPFFFLFFLQILAHVIINVFDRSMV
jgi:hypothetical protein